MKHFPQTEYLQMQVDKEELQNKLKEHSEQNINWESKINHLIKENHQLQREIDQMKVTINNFWT